MVVAAKVRVDRNTRTRTDTVAVNKAVIESWKAPPFQRPLRVNTKVHGLAEVIKQDGGVIPGVITLGMIGRDTYLLDGQHRIYAFQLAEVADGYADVRIHEFKDFAEMGEEFVNLNSRLVNFQPDDILRGLEESVPPLRSIRTARKFIGYGYVRRGSPNTPCLSMSALLRCWFGSEPETPKNSGFSAVRMVDRLTQDEADRIIEALGILDRAWGQGIAYARLWNNLNLTLSFWLYRRTVIGIYSVKTTRFTRELFTKGLMSLAADDEYLDYLSGRGLTEYHRSPTFSKMRGIISKRYLAETGQKAFMPQPDWMKGN